MGESTKRSLSLSVATLASGTGPSFPNHSCHDGSDECHWRAKKRNTVLAVIISTIGSFCLGNVLTWSALALADPNFQEKFPGIGDGSWVASLPLLGALCSAPVAGLLIAKIGRRRKLLVTTIPLAAGWVLIACAPNVGILYGGRFLTGFCAGAFTVSVPTYISEVCEDKIRGTLGIAFALMVYVGILCTFILGTLVDWFALSLVCACIPILFFIGMLFMPETPRYSVMIGKHTDARNNLRWLRRASSPQYIENEISTIKKSVDSVSASCRTSTSTSSAQFKDLFALRVVQPVGICVVLFFLGQFSGMNAISLYTVQIFQLVGTDIDEYVAAIIFGATQVLAVFIVPVFLVEKLGRRTLLISSELVMSLSLLLLGGFFYLREKNGGNSPQNLGWLPLTTLITTTIDYSMGIAPIPWVLTSELVPNDVKELASSCISIFYWTFSFISGKTFPDIQAAMGNPGVYWLSSGICLGGAIFVFLVVPETKGKSCEEIQDFFRVKSLLPSSYKGKSDEPPIPI